MEYNLPSEIVKDLNFGDDAKTKVMKGVEKLARAVASTLGASGKCVIYEDARGMPVITKDGVTVAQSVVLYCVQSVALCVHEMHTISSAIMCAISSTMCI